MTDFNSFRNAVLENDNLKDEVMSVVMTATRNGSGLGDGIATLAEIVVLLSERSVVDQARSEIKGGYC